MIKKFSETRDWDAANVKALCWHPHTHKFAAAMKDDSLRVYALNAAVSPTLKYKRQKSVSCMAWKPFSAAELAVGCQHGVLIWTVDPTSVAARPSASAVNVLEASGHAPITSLQWDPHVRIHTVHKGPEWVTITEPFRENSY